MLRLIAFSALLAAASACLCVNINGVNVRDAPCGNVIGNENAGACFSDLGGRVECTLDQPYTFAQVDYRGREGWIAINYLSSDDPSRCEILTCGDVRIVTRAEWGARPPTGVTYLNLPLSRDFVHHSAGSHCYTQPDCEAQCRAIQNYHMDTQGWSDIGYNFLIGEDGNAYEGRGWDVQGAHASNWNSQSHGICVMGTFTNGLPNQAALNALQALIDCGIEQGATVSNYDLHGHRDGGCTECPGNTLFSNWVVPHPHYGGHLDGCSKEEWGPSILYN